MSTEKSAKFFPEKLNADNEPNFYHWQFFKNHLDITRAFVEKNYNRNMHSQEFYEINIVTKGSGMHYLQDKKIPISVGDVFIIPPHTAHGHAGGNGFDVYHILLSDDFMNKYKTELQQLPSFYTLFSAEPLMRSNIGAKFHLSLDKEQFKHITPICNNILKFNSHENPFECVNRNHYVMVLISYFCEIYAKNFAEREAHISQDEIFMKSISYIHEYYYEKITIGTLAKIAQTSRSSYISKFKQICKMPPSSYISKQRIEAAENLLLNTSFSISEIAFRTGFYDAAHFTKIFTSVKNLSPLAYRKKHSINP